jgi:hypothetical protein
LLTAQQINKTDRDDARGLAHLAPTPASPSQFM